MAAFADLVLLDTGTWKALTSGNATAACIQNQGPYDIYVQCTGGAAPTDLKGAKLYAPGQGFDASATLAQLWPHIASGWTLYAMCAAPQLASKVSVSHA